MICEKTNQIYVDDFDRHLETSILTDSYNPSHIRYSIREALKEVKRLGRPLTEAELARFTIKE